MPQLDTLVDDIYELFDDNKSHKVNEENLEQFGENLKSLIRRRFNEVRGGKALRMSSAGQCVRKLWYKDKVPEKGEPLKPHTHIKFMYGDVIEELLLFLTKEAGHEVRGEQDELEVAGVKGHRDAVIDGVLVDVKSASTYSFKDFKAGRIHEVDKFGYQDQLGLYHYASNDVDPDIAAFLVMDKSNGHLCVDQYVMPPMDYESKIEATKEILDQDNEPERAYEPEDYQKGGNKKLPVMCSYCEFKWECHPGLRAFSYSNKPIFLSTVKKEPRVQEITRYQAENYEV